MTAFVIAAIVGSVVAVAYLTLALRTFLRIRSEVIEGVGDDQGDDATYEAQGGGFNWKAGAGVVASVGILSSLALGPGVWYLVPFLAIGSSIAVVVAFLIDEPAVR
jgi:hypothetical protein